MTDRTTRVAVVVLALLVLPWPATALAGSMCYVDKGVSIKLESVTGRASATFLDAASAALVLLKTVEESAERSSVSSSRVEELLARTIADYREALTLAEELSLADTFLRGRPFERLRAMLGITPGTLNHTRWEIMAKTAKESKAPATDLLNVCVASAESLKYTMASVKPGASSSLLRRALYSWSLVLSHGALVSDAFDASIR